VAFNEMMNPMAMFGMGGDPVKPDRTFEPRNTSFVLAAAITGKPRPAQPMAAEKAGEKKEAAKDGKPAAKPQEGEINVVLVADIDMLHQAFFDLRAQGEIPEAGLNFDFDNVTFVLNVLDQLAGEERFMDIRTRRRAHRTLSKIDHATEDAYKQTDASLKKIQEEYDKIVKEEEKSVQDAVKAIKDQIEKEKGDPMKAIDIATRAGMVQEARQKEVDAKIERLKRKKEEDSNKIKTDLNLQVSRIRNWYKLWAVLIPPILPLVVGIGVFVFRRMQEREGVSRTRLR
jgi:ABC-2 type transport system permease protein